MILNNLLKKFMRNILKYDSIQELGETSNQIKNYISNSAEAFEYALENPEKSAPVKNTGSFNTHNFIVQEITSLFLDKVVFIINCDLLLNNAIGNCSDICILYNNININFPLQSENRNLSLAYRVTACSFNVKATKSRCQLQYLKNFDNYPITAIEEIKDGQGVYYDKRYKREKLDFNFNNLKPGNRLIFPFPIKEFYKPNEIPNASFYFIFECENCEMFQFHKHIEHIPLQEYEEILNISSKEFL